MMMTIPHICWRGDVVNHGALDEEEEGAEDETAYKVHLTHDDYRIIVTWLEDEKISSPCTARRRWLVVVN